MSFPRHHLCHKFPLDGRTILTFIRNNRITKTAAVPTRRRHNTYTVGRGHLNLSHSFVLKLIKRD